jgi:hypothetical protein
MADQPINTNTEASLNQYTVPNVGHDSAPVGAIPEDKRASKSVKVPDINDPKNFNNDNDNDAMTLNALYKS